ncbi:MAG: TonB-dependent receptor [Candidatus Cloacimonetes bacterium]|nr:TonB-dependent receptor [Candidatus Cloacimonadota bacterium]
MKNYLRTLVFVILFLLVIPSAIFSAEIVERTTVQLDKNITVIVSDKTGSIIGANVTVKGTTTGSNTDTGGKVVLNNVPDDAVLVVSYIGYITQEVKIGNQTTIRIQLVEDIQKLDEIIVIGYGTAKRKDYTGSVSSVKLEDSPIALTNNLNALESVKGNVAGLDIGATNSAGGQPSMQIRGQKSISGSNHPLIVVDGVIFLGSIGDINPNDIASFDILKDATSAAAYGSRSANGVIIITTKKGRFQKPVITLNASGSMSLWGNKPHLMTGEQYIESVMARNGSTDLSWMTAQEHSNYDASKTTDWLDVASRTGWVQDYQLAVSGSSEKVNYYLSSAYSDNKGIIIGDDYNRVSLLGKLSTDITSWLRIGVDAAYTKRDYSGVSANLATAYLLGPYGVVYRDTEKKLLERYPVTQGLNNPLWGVNDGTRDNIDKRDNFRVNAFTIIKCPWIDGLSYRFNYAGNLTKGKSSDFYYESYYVTEGAYNDETRYSPSAYQRLLSKANGALSNYTTWSWVIDNILNYKNTFGRHSVDLTAVATRDRQTFDYVEITGSDFAANGNTTLGINGLHKATTPKIDMDGYERSNIGYLGRASYSFDDRYFFTGSLRHDGASVFGSNKKWGNYAALGLAWKITNEAFYPEHLKNEILNSMKLKVSWGKNGNQGLDPYGTLSTVTNGSTGGIRYEFGGSTILYGLNTSALGNSDLGWESTQSWNTGFESTWLKNRIFLDVDVYYSKTEDQIFTRNIPVMTGFKTMKSSMGQVDNRGIETTLRTVNIQNRDFNWTTGFIFWLNRNKLVHLYGEDLDGDGKEDDDISNSYFIGKSLGAIYGYKQDGIVQEEDIEYMKANGVTAGMPKYVDLSGGDGVITSADRTILGYRSPNFKLNMSNTLSYRDFELYVMLTGTFGGHKYFMQPNAAAYMTSGSGYAGGNGIYIPWWTPENRSNKYPAPTFAGDGRFQGLQNRGFARLQDVTLSYTFRQLWVKNAGISGLKVFLSAKNLATFTNWVGDDPETGAGARTSAQPVITSFTLGANLSF